MRVRVRVSPCRTMAEWGGKGTRGVGDSSARVRVRVRVREWDSGGS